MDAAGDKSLASIQITCICVCGLSPKCRSAGVPMYDTAAGCNAFPNIENKCNALCMPGSTGHTAAVAVNDETCGRRHFAS